LAFETIVSFNPDGLRSMGAEHLVPLASACQNLLLSSFPSQRVSIRVPENGRRSRCIQAVDRLAYEARPLSMEALQR
jgi:hypothetical protein